MQLFKLCKTNMKTARTDRSGNPILDGTWNIEPTIFNFPEFPQVSNSISNSATTETTYVTYSNIENGKSITVRFSLHENNATKFGDQLDGNFATKDEVLFALGLVGRIFVPETFLFISKQMVKKADMANYQEAELTINEMYDLGENADLTNFVGKLAKGSNWLIQGNTITKMENISLDILGRTIRRGSYIYTSI